MKKILIAIAAALGCSCAAASLLVTTDVPLDNSYYGYLDKLEGMGYIQDMPANTKPYSRLDMAKWVLQEVELSYSKSLQKDLLLHTAVGYGKLGDDTSKLVAVGLSWEY